MYTAHNVPHTLPAHCAIIHRTTCEHSIAAIIRTNSHIRTIKAPQSR